MDLDPCRFCHEINEKEAALTLEVLRELGEAQEEIEAMRASAAMLSEAS